MESIFNLQKRATELRNKTQVDSITPEEVGGLQCDVLAYIADMEQNSAGLGIRKAYTSTAAMYSDSNPIGSNGKPLRLGQLVVIYDPALPTAEGMCDIYAYQKPGWILMGNLTSIPDGTITSRKLVDGSVTEAKLADGSVSTAKLADGSVTIAKVNFPMSLVTDFGGMEAGFKKVRLLNKNGNYIAPATLLSMVVDSNGETIQFKTINGTPVLGKGNIDITAGLNENLLLNSRFSNNAEKWEGDGYETVEDIHYRGVSGVRVTGEIVQYLDNFEEGTYTLSFRYDNESSDPCYVYLDGDISDVVCNFSDEVSGDITLPSDSNRNDLLSITFKNNGDDVNIGFYTEYGTFTLSEVKLEVGSKATAYSLNTLDIKDVYTPTSPSGDGAVSESVASITGKLNLTNLTEVKAAQEGLVENEVRFFVITDSSGKIPSQQKCYDVPADVVRQMSLKTGSSLVDYVLDNVEVEPIGVSVGDLIALTKVSVKISDLGDAVGISIGLSGSVLVYQYKILHTTVAREENFDSSCTKGARGLLSPWEKTLINGSAKPTRWAWGWNLDDCLQSGVLAYTNATIGGTAANWTIFVDCAATPDGSGYYHLLQTAIGRDEINLGSIMTRLGYYKAGEAPTFLPWKVLAE